MGQRYPTRLIDISTDPYVGLYFAVEKDFSESGFVFVFNYNFNDLDEAGIISGNGATFLDVLRIDGNDGLPYHPHDDTLNLMKSPFPNQRINAQSGLFIWNRAIGANYFTGGFPFEIRAEHKKGILNELDSKGYNQDRLFPI